MIQDFRCGVYDTRPTENCTDRDRRKTLSRLLVTIMAVEKASRNLELMDVFVISFLNMGVQG